MLCLACFVTRVFSCSAGGLLVYSCTPGPPCRSIAFIEPGGLWDVTDMLFYTFLASTIYGKPAYSEFSGLVNCDELTRSIQVVPGIEPVVENIISNSQVLFHQFSMVFPVLW